MTLLTLDDVAEQVHQAAAINANETCAHGMCDPASIEWAESYLTTVDSVLDAITTERGAAAYDLPQITSAQSAEIRRRLREPYEQDVPLLRNPARTLDELPPDVRIGVVEDFDEDANHIKSFTVYYADQGGHPLPSSRDSIDDPEPERFFSGVVRSGYRSACDAFEVVYSIVAPGWGPLLYDIAMELASQYGGGLMSDRVSVSDDACRLWQHYLDVARRPDVQRRPLEARRVCAPKGACSTHYAFTKAPDTLNRLERSRRILYFDDRPPGRKGTLVHPPEPEESMAKPKPLAANPRHRPSGRR